MASIGDKFEIAIGEIFCGTQGQTLYRVEGFNSLVFDETGLSRLALIEKRHLQRGSVVQFPGEDTIGIVVKSNHLSSTVLWENGMSILYDKHERLALVYATERASDFFAKLQKNIMKP